jgi:hypothetical protein
VYIGVSEFSGGLHEPDYSRVYTRVLTRVDLNPDSNPAIEVGWVNPG